MKRALLMILSAFLLISIIACHAEIEGETCTLVLDTNGVADKSISYSVSTTMNYEYRIYKHGTSASNSKWSSFSFANQVKIEDLIPGKYIIEVRASKNGTVYYSGKSDVALAPSQENSVKIYLKKVATATAKGKLIFRDSCNYQNLKVDLSLMGVQREVQQTHGSAEYIKELDEGSYTVSIVYYSDGEIVGGQIFAVYIPYYETVYVDLNTPLLSPASSKAISLDVNKLD